MFKAIISRELNLIFAKTDQMVNPLIFFFITLSIFALCFSNLSDNSVYQQLNIGIIWLCLIFSILLGINRCFKEDFADGTIEQLLISGHIFELIITAKILANWLIYCLPLIISIPIAALILKLDLDLILNLMLIATLVSLIINFIASFGAALIVAVNCGHALLTILVLPLTIPIIIFANSAFIDPDPELFYSSLKFLLAALAFLAPILTFSASLAIRLNID